MITILSTITAQSPRDFALALIKHAQSPEGFRRAVSQPSNNRRSGEKTNKTRGYQIERPRDEVCGTWLPTQQVECKKKSWSASVQGPIPDEYQKLQCVGG